MKIFFLFKVVFFTLYCTIAFGQSKIEQASKSSSIGITSLVIDNNNFHFPIDDRGVIGDVGEDYQYCKIDSHMVIYSAGFCMSGYTMGKLWSNGVMSAMRSIDYEHGNIDSVPVPRNIHVVKSSDTDFGESWTNWQDAVKQGAEFYDGDEDGIYDPIDKNSNGKWDENEDRPNIIGDITAFTVFNDGVDSSFRRFRNVLPQGIEVKQTVFTYSPSNLTELSNVIYVKYSIENMGILSDTMKSVYFGAWADQDIGDSNDDLIGTDSLLKSTYSYNDSDDPIFGNNPPASFISIVQGPPVYIAGETFIDNNGNDKWDDGIDTPLDSAINRKGQLLGYEKHPGSRNNIMTASTMYLKSHQTDGDPDSEEELRNMLLGYRQNGQLIDPCNWTYGSVYNEDCSNINPKYIYSGNPLIPKGWINTNPYDQRQISSTGPFNLILDKPIDIIIAYTASRGIDNLNAITVSRENLINAIEFYETNFEYTPIVGVEEENQEFLEKYSLHQNYPNPFNPTTKISYSIPNQSFVSLKVFDVLGREVVTLVNKEQPFGNYEVEFDASNLTSGIYFYRIQAGQFVKSKKMILLK